MAARKREHLPALSPLELEAALAQLDALPVTAAAKRQLTAMLRAAQTPGAEHPAAVAASLPDERKANVAATSRGISTLTRGVMRRGRAALMSMSEADWRALVEADDA